MFRLFNYYAAISLIAFVCVVGPYSYFFAQHITGQMYEARLKQNLTISRLFFADADADLQTLSRADESISREGLLASEELDEFHNDLSVLVANTDIASVRLISPKGTILYSDHQNELGKTLEPHEFALAKQALSAGFASEHKNLRSAQNQHMLYSYLALKKDVTTYGLLELGSDISETHAKVAAFRFWFILLTSLSALMLYVMLAGFMKYFTSIIVRQYEELTENHAKLEQQAQELKRSNEELELFAYTASHDLQEPLRKVQAFGERLAKKHGDVLGKEGLLYLERMQDASARMRVLIQDLLTYSRVATKAEPFIHLDLNLIVKDVVSDLEVRIGQSGGRVDIANLPTLEADPLQMRQLFQNLIGNALKFHKPDEAPVVTVSCEQTAKQAIITVKDNGVGFDSQYAEKVFQIFQRLHGRGEYEGTGMGLAIVRKIVERHGGMIRAESQEGQGASFIITLPLPAPEQEVAKKEIKKTQTLHPQLT
ncbi:MAG: GHKL domain-containing protein [Trueperaceae bacterium]|nr:GHKL domain-containing protein [Trueperaceae bacterium]